MGITDKNKNIIKLLKSNIGRQETVKKCLQNSKRKIFILEDQRAIKCEDRFKTLSDFQSLKTCSLSQKAPRVWS